MDRFLGGDVSIRNSLRSNNFTSTIVLSLEHIVLVGRSVGPVLVVLREQIDSKSCFG